MSTETGGAGLAPAYRVQDLWFRYPGRSRRASGLSGQPGDGWVVQALDFEVRAGEVLGITGPNGSGKTTLLKLLSKILRATSGRIELFGREVGSLAQDAVARTVALVPQDGQMLFPFTVAEMVLMGRYPYHQTGGPLSRILGFGWESAMDRRLACQAMEETDVAHLAHRPLAEISGGERQRAVIARALAQDPDVLLLDEPTIHLDLNHQLEVCQILRRFNESRKMTIVLVSHDLNLASQYCDRLLLLKHGRVYRDGPPDAVLQPEVLREVYGCDVLVDRHPDSSRPRVNLPAWVTG